MVLLALAASGQSQLRALVIAMAFGVVVGVLGHIVGSRTLILTGIVIIGGISAYFLFGVAKVT